MPSYGLNAVQAVPLNQGAIFDTINGCNRGYIIHEDQTATTILRGVVSCPCKKSAKYKVTAIANIAIPEGGTVTPIAVALVANGEVRPTSRAISTPAAALEYNNVTVSDIIEVPAGCCFMISLDSVVASSETTYTPAPSINMQNLNITIDKIQ